MMSSSGIESDEQASHPESQETKVRTDKFTNLSTKVIIINMWERF